MKTAWSSRASGPSRRLAPELLCHHRRVHVRVYLPRPLRHPAAADDVDNDKTLEVLGEDSGQSHARAGADMVAPSRHDGRPRRRHPQRRWMRTALIDVPIMSYCRQIRLRPFTGPFREAAGSAPAFGDRQGYQMDPHNRKEALKECALDAARGRGYPDGQARHGLSRHDPRPCRQRFDLPLCGLLRCQRGIRDDQGRRRRPG